MRKQQVDVCVIGAGPAGVSTARQLAAAGLDVLVLEEHAVIGKPVDCCGIISGEAFERLDLPREAIRDRFDAFDVISPAGSRVAFRPGRALAFIVDRALFDQQLADRARQAGATLWTGIAARRLEVHAAGVRLTAEGDGGETVIDARAVVLAQGPRYAFQQQLGMGRPARYLKTVQAEAETDMAVVPQLFLGSQVARGSFAWYLPVRQPGAGCRLKIGLTATGDSQASFHAFLERLRALGCLPERPREVRAWMIPISPLPKTYATRVLAVGDAAGQTKPTTGGGLYYGLLCAREAAAVLAEACRRDVFSEAFLSAYERRWRHMLSREFRVAQRFRQWLERLQDDELERCFSLLQHDGLLDTLERDADFDWHWRAIQRALRSAPWARTLLRGAADRRLAELLC